MKPRILLLVILFLFSTSLLINRSQAAVYKTTNIGGLFTSTTTWQGGIVPNSPSDTIIVRGNLEINVNVNTGYLQVDSVGTLQNANTGNYQVSTGIGITNYGSIKNNTSYTLGINLNGFLNQYGSMSNHQLSFFGTNIDIDAKKSISCTNVFNPSGLKYVNILSDTLEFNNTVLNINGCLINFNNGVWIQNGGAMIYTTIYSNQLELNMNGGAYLQGFNCNANLVTLNGVINVVSATFYPNTTNTVVHSNGLLRNKDTGNYTLTVEGDFVNNGTIQNNYYNFTIDLKGDLTNNGTWSNYSTNLWGAGNQNIALNQPFDGQFLTSYSGGHLVATSNLIFNNTSIDLNGDTLFYNNDLSPVTLNGGYMREFKLVGNAPPYEATISLTANAYVYSAVFTYNEITTTNTFQFQSGMTVNGNLKVQGIFQNDDNTNQTATINGNIVNDGTITDNYYTLTINVAGDIENNGTWSNYYTHFTGTTDQAISCSQPFDGERFTNTTQAGKLMANTALYFNNSLIDINYDTLVFNTQADSLYLNNCNLKNGHFIKESAKANGNLRFNLVNNSYLTNTTVIADDIRLYGTFWFSSTMNFFGHLVVMGTLQNHSSGNQSAYIYGHITNNGNISNNYYNLNIYVSGDIHQQGQWLNQNTYLTGANDQNLHFTSDFDGANLTNSNPAGKIIAKTPLKFNNTHIELAFDTLLFAGTADSLVINQNYLNQAKIIRDNTAKASGILKIVLLNNAYVQYLDVSAENTRLYGVFQFANTLNFYGDVTILGTFQNRDNGSFTANFSSNLVNKGNIKNNYYNLTLNVAGDLWQQGFWTCYTTNLNGAANQNIFFSNDFNGQNFINTNNAGKIIAQTSLVFDNTIVDLNNDTLEFAGIADSLTINSKYLIDAIITCEAAKSSGILKFNLTGGAYTQNLITAADEIFLHGVFQFSLTMQFHGNVTVNGILRNRDTGSFTAYVYGSITNNGTITNNYYNLTMYLYGDINQHGLWNVYNTYLASSNAQTLNTTQPFTGSNFTDSDAGSPIVTTSNLVFQGLSVDLNNATLTLPQNAVLAVKGGYLREAALNNSGAEIYMDNDSYIENVSMVSPTLTGTVQVRSNVVFSGHVRIIGTLQNDDINNMNLYVNGSIENHGTIQDNYYFLRIYVQEDILNNGTWTNTFTQLEGYSGAINQTVKLQDGHYITGQLKLFSNNSSNFAWYKNGSSLSGNPDYTGATFQILTFNVPADNIRAGVYNCNTLAGWSRNITITTTTSDYPLVDLRVIMEGPFNGSEMTTLLNAGGGLPLSQPYTGFPKNYFGSELVGAIPNTDVVDWLLIEFRDAVDANNANQGTRVHRQAAFVLSDGSVVGLDGTSYLTVPHVFVNNMYVLVHHRNHLGILSANALTETGGLYSYDFTYDYWNSHGGTLAVKNVGTNLAPVYGMIGGNSNNDGQINQNDKNNAWNLKAGWPVNYDLADFNLDAQVDNRDKNDVWYENIGSSEQYPQ